MDQRRYRTAPQEHKLVSTREKDAGASFTETDPRKVSQDNKLRWVGSEKFNDAKTSLAQFVAAAGADADTRISVLRYSAPEKQPKPQNLKWHFNRRACAEDLWRDSHMTSQGRCSRYPFGSQLPLRYDPPT